MGLIAEIGDDRWRLGISDSSLLGWATVGVYALTSLFCVLAYRRTRWTVRTARYWKVLAVGMLVLTVNRQLNLQNWLTKSGRDYFISQGWYGERRVLQAYVIVIFSLAGLVAMVAQVVQTYRSRLPVMPLFGAALLVGHLVLRTSSLHQIDSLLTLGVPGFRLGSLMQLVGLILIGIPAFKVLGWLPNRSRRR